MSGVQWFFQPPDLPLRWADPMRWWEAHRVPFNCVIGAYGVFCLLVFSWGLSTSGHLRPGDDAIEPLGLLAAPVLVNVLYSLGWAVEIPVRVLRPQLSPQFGPLLLKLGLGLGLVLITLPAALWGGLRVLQVVGVLK